MTFKIAEVRKDLQAFDLKKLFIEEMGWDIAKQTTEIPVNGEYFQLTMVAHKHGLAAFVCSPRADGAMPNSALRYKIETQVRKIAHEHLIIFTNKNKTVQKWQWVRREPGKPIARREYDKVEVILQRLQAAVFELDEEDDLTIIEVGRRVKNAFDVEKVTKKFYERFKTEHTAFLKFLKDIPDEHLQQWYASVTLNRLMFVYFIQSKRFLNDDPNYLKNHLNESKKQGKDLFYTDFLCPLFFEGFAKKERTAKVKKLFGNIPYLNGGIFEQHQIEELYGEKIQIPDKAFDQLFEFFDGYRWHLDERVLKEGNEINPDVLGYIFEKYINQKQMGAYYTKEDITEYNSKNTIIPHIFDVAQKECKVAFTGEGSVWRHLQDDPDRYVYEALRYGAKMPLPPEIAIGESDPKRREGWNKSAPEEFALPTEIWREVVARRRRYQEVKEKLAGGMVTSINDLITLNLDIRQFAQDTIEDSDADLLTAFWHALSQIKILDPTVGSGAFLFAALNVLEPMYEACIERMRVLVKELDASSEKHSPKKYEHFRKALEQVNERPDEDYFIFKSIIINNLYGVDIMDEAVEICKLRLFLKLAAQVEVDPSKENLGIEPLPDIDFNIRAGNTLVGFATREDVKRSVQFGTVGGVQSEKLFAMPEEEDQLKLIEQKAEDVDRLYKIFRAQQTTYGGEVNADDKKKLEKKLKALDDELNILLARQYGIHNPKGEKYKEFLKSHTPFHWFVEFYGIMNEGGFDVIIGNPPYVEYRNVRSTYQVREYKTEESENLYIYAMERSLQLISPGSWVGLIVPISLVSIPDNYMVRRMLLEYGTNWFSNYAIRPAKLFEGVEQRLTICILHRDKKQKNITYSTKYNQWFMSERPHLFEKITYDDITQLVSEKIIPKSGSNIATRILEKITHIDSDAVALHLVNESKNKLYFHRTPGYWIRMMDFLPYYKSPTADRSIFHTRELSVSDPAYAKFIGAVINSTFYFFNFFALGNCRNLTLDDVKTFPLGKPQKETLKTVGELFDRLMADFNRNSFINHRGSTEFQEFDWDLSKPIIDEIDRALARHYGLSDEELDFIINYDVKYRMGAELEEE